MAVLDPRRPRVGISACLLGEAVRYDGGHRRMAWLVEDLAERVTFVSVCPEVEVGLGTPREPIRLERREGHVGIRRIERGDDLTPRFEAWLDKRIEALAALDLAGFVFKSGSPSCGLLDVPVFDPSGRIVGTGDGIFARALRRRWPDLPVVDDGDLDTEAGRGRFETELGRYADRRQGGA